MVATQSVSHLAWPKIIFSVRVGGQFFKHYFLFFAIPNDDFQSVVTTLNRHYLCSPEAMKGFVSLWLKGFIFLLDTL